MADYTISIIEMAVSYEEAANLFSYDPISGTVVRIAPGPDYGKIVRSVDGQGYMRTRIGKPYFQLHRIAWLLAYREWPKSRLDHRDGNRTNNALSNLREATALQNSANCGKYRNNKTGFKGVVERDGKFLAFIRANGRQKYLGTFSDKLLAAEAYAVASIEKFGDFARPAIPRAECGEEK